MHRQPHKRTSGFTMVELLVVLAVVALLASLAIPTLARLGPGSRDEISNTSQTVFSLHKAARIYAATYRVNTAVVYFMDNHVEPRFGEPGFNPEVTTPISDTITGARARIIRGAAVYFEMADRCGEFYVPIPRSEGSFIEFAPNAGILLQDPTYTQPNDFNFTRARLNGMSLPSSVLRERMGLLTVAAVTSGDPCAPPSPQNPWVSQPMLAHKYTQEGFLALEDNLDQERFTIHIGYSPDVAAEERTINPDSLTGPVQAVPMYLYRSTGRIKIGERNEGII